MFATIIIILPSMYTGGEVRVVHGGEEKTFDCGSMSQLSTSVLAWYADVVHEVKPITSGFRLALSYNLIQPGRRPVPHPPTDISALSKLEQIFAKWSEAVFDNPPEVICYKLQHEYSRSNLRRGLECLNGIDAYKVSRVKDVAEKYGINLGLGQLVRRVTISENDFFGEPFQRKRRNDYGEVINSEDDSQKSRDDTNEESNDSSSENSAEETGEESTGRFWTSMTVSGLVDLEGEYLLQKKNGFYVDGVCIKAVLIPKGSFLGARPNEVEHTDYTGNVSRLPLYNNSG